MKNYKQSYNFYDSLQAGDTTLKNFAEIQVRKNALAKIVGNLNIIEREDSLQLIAAMPETERNSFIKKLSKKLMKERGMKEGENNYNSSAAFFNQRNQSQDIFGNNTKKGEWYFYNNSVKGQGYNEFKRIWGKRENVDNWRISSASMQNATAADARNAYGDPMAPAAESENAKAVEPPVQLDISENGLLANVPVTAAQLDTSNSKVARSLFRVGKDYQELLEDYPAAIDAYQKSLKRFPDSLYHGELYMNLSFCYQKIGNQQMADYYKGLLLKNFNDSKFAMIVSHPDAFNPSKKDTAAERRYDNIYNLFIEGNFDQAIKEKNAADSLYGQSYWNPQLLYIQSVYYIKNREDSAAKKVLGEIISNYPNSPMKEKAITMIDVLGRRDSIERYLTNLKVERAKEDSQVIVFDDSKPVNRVAAPVTAAEKPVVENKDVVAGKAELNPEKKLAPPVKNSSFTFDPMEPQNVVMVLTKVDPVYSSEAKNAFNRYNSQSFSTNKIQVVKDTLDSERTFLIFSEFPDAAEAIKYRDKLKHDAPAQISWLPAQKYAFYIISDSNLELLKDNKKLQAYIDLLNKKYPGKF